jgi:hypothetical protein
MTRTVRINPGRLWASLMELKQIGAYDDKAAGLRGVRRLAPGSPRVRRPDHPPPRSRLPPRSAVRADASRPAAGRRTRHRPRGQ